MNNLLNEYFRLNFELNIELNHFLARFNVKMNNQNVSATPIQPALDVVHHKHIKGGYFELSKPITEYL